MIKNKYNIYINTELIKVFIPNIHNNFIDYYKFNNSLYIARLINKNQFGIKLIISNK
jgi:hypothetical protein